MVRVPTVLQQVQPVRQVPQVLSHMQAVHSLHQKTEKPAEPVVTVQQLPLDQTVRPETQLRNHSDQQDRAVAVEVRVETEEVHQVQVQQRATVVTEVHKAELFSIFHEVRNLRTGYSTHNHQIQSLSSRDRLVQVQEVEEGVALEVPVVVQQREVVEGVEVVQEPLGVFSLRSSVVSSTTAQSLPLVVTVAMEVMVELQAIHHSVTVLEVEEAGEEEPVDLAVSWSLSTVPNQEQEQSLSQVVLEETVEPKAPEERQELVSPVLRVLMVQVVRQEQPEHLSK